MGGIMNASSLLEAWVETGNQIDSEWSMYIVVHLGLFWFFFLVHRPLLFVERAIALFAYGAFAYINGNSLISTYNMLEAMRSDLVANFRDALANTPATANELAQNYYGGRDELILVTHGVAFAVVALLLIFRNVIIRRYERDFPRHATPGTGG
jgi:hypothetical protein